MANKEINKLKNIPADKAEDVSYGEETRIGKNVIIEGNLRTTGPIAIMGSVTGNVVSTSDIVVCGKVGGFIKGNNIKLNRCEINDTVTATCEITISEDSVINGDIKAGSVVNDGTVTGSVKSDRVTLSASSKTAGDILCKTISIAKGAIVEGNIITGKK